MSTRVLITGLLLWASPALADTGALFFVSRDAPPKLVGAAVESIKSIAQGRGVELLYGPSLRERIGWPPEEALEGCGPDVVCLAGLGRTARAERVVVARFSAGKGGSSMLMQLLAIDVGSGEAVAKIDGAIASADEIGPWFQERFDSLFGGAGDPELDLEPLLELEAIDQPMADAAGPAWLNPWFFAGVGGVGLAAVFAAVGAVFGANGDAMAGTITSTLDLRSAVAREGEVNQAYDVANAMFIAAGISAAVGIGLGAIAFVPGGDDSGASTSVEVSAVIAPSGASLRWRW